MRNRSLYQMTEMIGRGLFFFIGPPGASANYISVDNVIDALCICGRRKETRGTVYNLSDHRTVEDFVGVIAVALGKSPPVLRLPEGPVRFAARTLGKLPGFPLTESRVDALTTRAVYPVTRIERELGYAHAVTMEDALFLLASGWRTRR
jgi:nucleoside-diphosphate-sugar epimerase